MLYDIPKEKLIEVFGHTRPNTLEIDALSNLYWKQGLHWRRDIQRTILPRRLYTFMGDLGYYNILDYQIRQRQIRFTKEDILATALLAGLTDFLVVERPNDWPPGD